jgi:SAM-dependent methyltransferase
LAIALSPHYPQILERLKTGNENFLDLGCCFGQEIRRLVADGAPSSNLYGSDLRREFFELGYEFFGDRQTLQSKFIAADVFDPNSGLQELDGKIDILYAGSFLHLFGYEKQVEVCVRIVRLLKEKKGGLIVGRQVGHVEAGERSHRTNNEETMFRHNEESFKNMWELVGEKTGSSWRVEVKAGDIDDEDRRARGHRQQDEGLRRLRFSVFRL